MQMFTLDLFLSTFVAFMMFIMLSVAIGIIVVAILWFSHVPYRIIFNENKWQLQRRDNIFDSWATVFDSEFKTEVQARAKEALLAHRNMMNFIS